MNGFDINFNAATGAGHVSRTDASFGGSRVDKTTTDAIVKASKATDTGEGWGFMGVSISKAVPPAYEGPESMANYFDYLTKLGV